MPGDNDEKIVDLSSSRRTYHQCDECGGEFGYERKCTGNILCTECRNLDEHKLITRSTALTKYCLSASQLDQVPRVRVSGAVDPKYGQHILYWRKHLPTPIDDSEEIKVIKVDQ